MVLPPGWRLISSQVVLAGRIVAAQLSLRGGEVWLVSAYFHPDELTQCCRSLQRFLAALEGGSHFLVGGDFNRAWEASPAAWEDLVDSLDLHLIAPPTTFRGPTGDTALDGYLLPGRFIHQAGFVCRVSAVWPHDRFGHAALWLSIAPPHLVCAMTRHTLNTRSSQPRFSCFRLVMMRLPLVFARFLTLRSCSVTLPNIP